MRADSIYLKPGQICIADRPTVVSTVLGSCVAVTMFSPKFGIGGICHALLPRNPFSHDTDTFRYVDSSLLYMLERFAMMGVKKEEIELKIVGGAEMLDQLGKKRLTIGRQNIETALAVLRREDLGFHASDVGGSLGRKIRFHTHTGHVFFKRLGKMEPGEDESTRNSNRAFIDGRDSL